MSIPTYPPDPENPEPCRFCGSRDLGVMEYEVWPNFGWHVNCEDCGALGPEARSREEAWELWNRKGNDYEKSAAERS